MTDQYSNDVLRELRECFDCHPGLPILQRAVDEIERLLRGEFTEYELAVAGLNREDEVEPFGNSE